MLTVATPPAAYERGSIRASTEADTSGGICNIYLTVRYTELAPHRFRDFWDD